MSEPEPGAHLEDAVARGHAREPDDAPRGVGVDEEVLAERLGRREAVAPRAAPATWVLVSVTR